MKLGMIGLGAMGLPIAMNLAKENIDICVYDVRQEQREKVSNLGAKACETAKEVAENSEVIFTSLPNAKILDQVLEGKEGILKNIQKEGIIIDLSTVSPASVSQFAERAREVEAYFIDAPVSGGAIGAQNGTLTVMVGGDEEIYKKVRPLLEIIGKKIYYMGKSGLGATIKMVNNLLLGCNMSALAEAINLGKACGLDPECMFEIIRQSSGDSYVLNAKMEKFILPQAFEGGFAIDLQYKDLGLALEMAQYLKMPLPMTSQARQQLEACRAKELGKKDISSMVCLWEKETDCKKE